MTTPTPFGDTPGPSEPPGAQSYPSYSDIVHDGSTAREPSERRRRGFLPWLVGVAALALIGGGVFAVRAAVSGSTDQPAGVIPADAVMYLRLDVDPSAGQKIEALRFANTFPAFRDEVDIPNLNADLREKMFELIQGDEPTLAALDYESDVAPWLGNRVGFALMPSALAAESDEMSPPDTASGAMLAIEVTDEAKAKAGLDKILASAGGTGGYTITDGYALVAASTEIAEGFAADAKTKSLADDDAFSSDMTALGDQGIASLWFDGGALSELAQSGVAQTGLARSGLSQPAAGAARAGIVPGLGDVSSSQATALRFGNRYLEIATAGRTTMDITTGTGTAVASKLPDTTLFAASLGDGRTLIENGWQRLSDLASEEDSSFDQDVRALEKQTGLTIPADIGTLLGDGFAFAVDDQDFSSLDDPSQLRIGALSDTDVDAAQRILDTILSNVPEAGQLGLTRAETDGMLAVSLDADYARSLGGGSLGSTDGYQLAVHPSSDTFATMYLNVDRVEHSLLDALTNAGASQDVIDNIVLLQAVGASASIEDGVVRGSFRVVVNE